MFCSRVRRSRESQYAHGPPKYLLFFFLCSFFCVRIGQKVKSTVNLYIYTHTHTHLPPQRIFKKKSTVQTHKCQAGNLQSLMCVAAGQKLVDFYMIRF
jgi:hypothetical protein